MENFRKGKLYDGLFSTLEVGLGINPNAEPLIETSDFSDEALDVLEEALDIVTRTLIEEVHTAHDKNDPRKKSVNEITDECTERLQRERPDLWLRLEEIMELHSIQE